MTHWLDHSLVLAWHYRVRDAGRVGDLVDRRRRELGRLGARHVLVYESTSEPGRVLVMTAIHAREPLLDLLRSRTLFEWFDAAGVRDIPAVFAGELWERLVLAPETGPSATEVMFSVVTTVDDPVLLLAHVRGSTADLRRAGIRNLSMFTAFDDPREILLVLHVDDEQHARRWIEYSELAAEWLTRAGIGAYPPAFTGRFRRLISLDER